ncbi:MAG: LytTR family DNA-binding domain-containing protein [Eubacterium sp.]
MINIAICDDNPLDLTQLEGSILTLSKELGLPVCLTTYPDGKTLLAHLDHTDLNGIDVAQAIAKRSDAFIIFTTTSSEFALEAIDLGAVHYLIKPITEEALREVYRRCAARSTKRRDPLLEITVDRRKLTLFQSDIQYIAANNKTSIIYTSMGSYRTYEAIHHLANRLDTERFIVPQRSYIVNLDYISRFQKTRITLKNGQEITVGRQSRNEVANRYTDYLAGIVRRNVL